MSNLAECKRGRIRGFQGNSAEEHLAVARLKDRIIKGMSTDEIRLVSPAIDQLQMALSAKFFRKEKTINECQSVKQVNAEVWSL